MKRRSRSLLLAAALAFCCVCGLFIFLNRLTPRLPSGAAMPGDIALRPYALCKFERTDGGYAFSLRDVPRAGFGGLSLIFGDVADFSLYCNGEHIYTYCAADEYKRLIQVDMAMAGSDGEGTAELVILTESPYVFEGGFLAGLVVFKPKLLLGDSGSMADLCTFSTGCIMLEVGVFALMSINCIVLYMGKRSEKYLLLLSFMSASLFLASLLNLGTPFSLISQGTYTAIRPFLHMFPMVANASICFYLMRDAIPRRWRCLTGFGNIFVLTFAALTVQAMAPNWANLMIPLRVMLLIPVLAVLCAAYRQNQRGAALLCIAYVCSEAMANGMTVLQNISDMGVGAVRTFGRISQAGHMVYLIACMVVIMQRFSSKFAEADELVGVLDKRVEERTAQLRDEQETKHKMMTNIFHDLRSPIFAMQGYVSMLESSKDNLPLALPVLKERLSFLEKLIENLFLMAKLEERAITFAMEDVDLAELCEKLCRASLAQAEEKGIALRFEKPPALPPACGEAFRLGRALQEILENAILYTPPGGRVILSLEEAGDMLKICVRDNGKGIPGDDLPFVFDRYYRSSRADHRRSSGLGLSIAKEIIAMHGGDIGVESQEGEGTRFTVRLPRAQ